MICLFYSFFLSLLHRHIREAWELFAAKILSHGEKKKKIGKIRETQVPKFCFTPSACLGIVRWILEDEEFTELQECAFEKGVWEGEQEILWDTDTGQTASHCNLLLSGVSCSSHSQCQDFHLSTISTLCWKCSNIFHISSVSSLSWVHCIMQSQIDLQRVRQVTQNNTCSCRDILIQHSSAKEQYSETFIPKSTGWMVLSVVLICLSSVWEWLVLGTSEKSSCVPFYTNNYWNTQNWWHCMFRPPSTARR